jgi:hypothetical protein
VDQSLQQYLETVGDEVQAAGLSADAKETALWGLGQLPKLYAQFRVSSESRYADQITRVLQGVLKELNEHKPACPAAQRLAAAIPERLRSLHEEAGLPGLHLKAPRVPTPRTRKGG